MPEPLLVNFALALLTAGSVGLVAAHLKLRNDFSEFKLRVAENNANKADLQKFETALEALRTELQEVLKGVYEIRAQLKAAPHGGQ